MSERPGETVLRKARVAGLLRGQDEGFVAGREHMRDELRARQRVPSCGPLPLVPPTAPPAEYPVDALGSILGPAARAIARLVQAPAAMAGNSVLAAAALAAQAHADVQTFGGHRPLSLFSLTSARSGDRKSETDRLALAAVREHQCSMEAQYKQERERREALRREGKGALVDAMPPLRLAGLLCTDPSPEGLYYRFRDGQYSQGIFTDEGGQFLGGYAMSPDNELRTIAMFSRCWGGATLDRVRAGGRDREDHPTLYGRRLSMHLMAQPHVARLLLGSPLYRSQGFLARFLPAEPEDIVGTRTRDPDAPIVDPLIDSDIRHYQDALAALLSLPPHEDVEVGGLAPHRLDLSDEARHLLASAYNETEVAQGGDGPLAEAREWASKSMEHACRIAGVLTLLRDHDAGIVDVEAMRGGLTLAMFYLSEYMRLVGLAATDADITIAQQLLAWMQRRVASQQALGADDVVSLRDITRLAQPKALRAGRTARRALAVLDEHSWLVRAGDRRWRLRAIPAE